MKELNDKEIIELSKKNNIKVLGIYNKDIVPNDLSEGWYILNLDDSDGSGTHWTTFLISKNNNIYFDSFGFCPPEHLHKILSPYTYSKKEIQNPLSSSCGWFALQCIKWVSDGEPSNSLKVFENFINNYGPYTEINEMKLFKYFQNLN